MAAQRLHPKHYPLYALFLLSLATCALPFLYRIPVQEAYLLIAIAAPVVALQITVSIRTIASVRERETSTTGRNSHQIVWKQWREGIRPRIGWHIAANILKVGLALGLMQYFSAMVMGSPYLSCEFPQQPLYILCYSSVYEYNYTVTELPQLYKVVAALIGLAIVGAGEAGFCVALGIQMRSAVGAAVRLTGIVVALFAFALLDDYIYELAHRYHDSSVPFSWIGHLNAEDEANLLRLIGSGIVATAEGGVIPAANIMRPYEPSIFHITLTLFSMMLGTVLFTAMTAVSLRLTQYSLQRRGVPPPRKQPSLPARFRQNLHPVMLKRSLQALNFAPARQKSLFIGMFLAVGITQLPYYVYMDEAMSGWLLLMFTITLTAQVVVTLYTLNVATSLLNREYHHQTFDLLRLTPIGTRQIMFSQWWAVMRHTWMVYVLLVPIRLGMAYAAMQYLNAMPFAHDIPDMGRAFSHLSYNNYAGLYPPYPVLYPQLYQVILTAIGVGAVCAVEMAMVAAVGLLAAVMTGGKGSRTPLLMLTLRLSPVFLALLFIFLTSQLNQAFLSNTHNVWRKDGLIIYFEYRHFLRILENLQVSASGLIDGGIMAGANLLRPTSVRLYYILDTLLSFGWVLIVNFMLALVALQTAVRRIERE